MRLSNEGFFLLDALLSVFILSCLCILCFTIYGLMERYEEGYQNYQYRSNSRSRLWPAADNVFMQSITSSVIFPENENSACAPYSANNGIVAVHPFTSQSSNVKQIIPDITHQFIMHNS